MPWLRVVLAFIMFAVICLVRNFWNDIFPPVPRPPPTPSPPPAPSPHYVNKCELEIPAEMSSIANTSDGRIAVGTYTGGIDMVTSECKKQNVKLITQLKQQGVTIFALGFLSDGSCAVVDSLNSLIVFKPKIDKWTKSDVNFEALSRKENGLVSLSVHGYGSNERIYVSYRKAKKILVFSPSGGKAENRIPCIGYEPTQITIFIKDIIVTDNRTIRIIDMSGNEKYKRDKPTDSEEKKSGVYSFAGVTKRDTVLIAWVDHNGKDYRTVRIDEYTEELKHVKKLVSDHKIPKHKKRWWYFVTELISGEIAFCTIDKLYIFKPVNPGRGGGEL